MSNLYLFLKKKKPVKLINWAQLNFWTLTLTLCIDGGTVAGLSQSFIPIVIKSIYRFVCKARKARLCLNSGLKFCP